MMSCALTATLAAATVMVASCALGKRVSSDVRKAETSNEATSPDAVKATFTTGR